MQRKQIIMTLLISLSLVLLAVLTSCVAEATNTPGPAPTTQPPPTVTVIQYVTVTPTPAESTFVPTALPTIYPTNYTPTPVTKVQDYNNTHFYITKEIIGYNRTPLADGTFQESPIYKDVYVDMNLAGFKTKEDAIFVSPIPTITKHYDWFVRFSLPSAPSYRIPWTMNWGVETDADDPEASVSFYLIQQNTFENYYYSDPNSLTVYKRGEVRTTDRGVSELGEHGLTVNDGNGIYIALFRTNNPDSILNWWIKYGGNY